MKEGRKQLDQLSDKLQDRIIDDFGSLDYFYFEVYYLEREKYNLKKYKRDGYEERLAEVQSLMTTIEQKLEYYGVKDGSEITFSIISDFTEKIALSSIKNFLINAGFAKDKIDTWLEEKGLNSEDSI